MDINTLDPRPQTSRVEVFGSAMRMERGTKWSLSGRTLAGLMKRKGWIHDGKSPCKHWGVMEEMQEVYELF